MTTPVSSIADVSEVLLHLGLSASSTEVERALAQEALRRANAAVIRYLQYDPVQKTHTEYLPAVSTYRQGREVVWEVTETQAYSRYLSEASTDELQLTHIPVREITSLKVDYDARSGTRSGSFAAASARVEGTDFWPNYDGKDSSGNKICRDGIIRAEGRWPDVAGSVEVIYIAGYTDEELHGQDSVVNAGSILDVVVDEAVRRFLKVMSRSKRALSGFAGPFTSENLGEYSYSVDSGIFAKLVGGSVDLLPENEQKLMEFMRCNFGVN